jgi:hypothetical protein
MSNLKQIFAHNWHKNKSASKQNMTVLDTTLLVSWAHFGCTSLKTCCRHSTKHAPNAVIYLVESGWLEHFYAVGNLLMGCTRLHIQSQWPTNVRHIVPNWTRFISAMAHKCSAYPAQLNMLHPKRWEGREAKRTKVTFQNSAIMLTLK